MLACLQPTVVFLITVLLAVTPARAFETPLSDEAIREAYFLGQRGADSLPGFLAKYTKTLPPPEAGPHISSVTVLTPFALLAQLSSQHSSGYSAQQARLDHLDKPEIVRIVVQIQFTDSFGAMIPAPAGSRSGSSSGFVPRPYDFWKDFEVRVFSTAPREENPPPPSDSAQDASQEQQDQAKPPPQIEPLRPETSHGEPNVSCAANGGCQLIGATLYFDFIASAFDPSSAVIEVAPPEGETLSVEFDLSALR